MALFAVVLEEVGELSEELSGGQRGWEAGVPCSTSSFVRWSRPIVFAVPCYNRAMGVVEQ